MKNFDACLRAERKIRKYTYSFLILNFMTSIQIVQAIPSIPFCSQEDAGQFLRFGKFPLLLHNDTRLSIKAFSVKEKKKFKNGNILIFKVLESQYAADFNEGLYLESKPEKYNHVSENIQKQEQVQVNDTQAEPLNHRINTSSGQSGGLILHAKEEESGDFKLTTAMNYTTIVAKFPDGELILVGELLEVFETFHSSLEDVPFESIYEALLDHTIDMKLISKAARKVGIDRDPKVLKKIAESQEHIIQKAYLDQEAAKLITIEALEERYLQVLGMIPRDHVEIRLKHILVKTEAEAEEIIKRIAENDNFDLLAIELSTDEITRVKNGDLGYVRREDLPREFGNIVFSTPSSTLIPEPVNMGELGFSVVYVADQRPVELPKFKDIEDEIRKAIMPQYVADRIKKLRTEIEIEKFNMDLTELEMGQIAAKFSDGELILVGELLEVFETFHSSFKDVPFKNIYEALLNHAIDMKLISKAARKVGIDRDLKVLKKIAENQEHIIQKAYLDQEAAKLITIEALKERYLQVLGMISRDQVEIRLKHILVKTEAEAEEIIKRIAENDNFDLLAIELSTDEITRVNNGDLGYVRRKDLPKEFGNIVFSTPSSTLISEPVNLGELGFSVVYVADQRPVEPPKFKDIEDEIRKAIMPQYVADYIKKLRQGSCVIKTNQDDKVMDYIVTRLQKKSQFMQQMLDATSEHGVSNEKSISVQRVYQQSPATVRDIYIWGITEYEEKMEDSPHEYKIIKSNITLANVSVHPAKVFKKFWENFEESKNIKDITPFLSKNTLTAKITGIPFEVLPDSFPPLRIGSEDRRSRVDDPLKTPYSPCGQLQMVFRHRSDNKKYIISMASGTLISPNGVLTCVSNLFFSGSSHEDVCPYIKSAIFYPALNGSQKLYSSLITHFLYDKDWETNNVYRANLAVLRLKEPLGNIVGWAGIHHPANGSYDMFLDGSLNPTLVGYPALFHNHMYIGQGPIIDIKEKEGVLFHQIDTSAGNGGSCIGTVEDNIIKIFGVHSGRFMSDKKFGVYINQENYEKIESWILRASEEENRGEIKSASSEQSQNNSVVRSLSASRNMDSRPLKATTLSTLPETKRERGGCSVEELFNLIEINDEKELLELSDIEFDEKIKKILPLRDRLKIINIRVDLQENVKEAREKEESEENAKKREKELDRFYQTAHITKIIKDENGNILWCDVSGDKNLLEGGL